MHKLLLASVAVTGLLAAGAASAADLPRRTAPIAPLAPVALPIFTWTGFYVGVNAGYGWGTNDNATVYDPALGYVYSGGGRNGGFVGGGQVGYNWQSGIFVLGAEADIQYADLGNRRDDFASYGTPGYYGYGGGASLDWFGTVRARAGLAFDRFLVYGTGGFAYGGGDTNNYYYGAPYYFANNNSTRTGWTVGGGVEYAFTNNLTAKIEGLYVNLNNKDNGYYAVPYTYGSKKETEFGVVRAGLNYKFNTF